MEIRSNVIDGFVNGFFEDNWLLWIILNDSISGSLITHPPTRVPAACRLEEIKNGAWSITLTKNKNHFLVNGYIGRCSWKIPPSNGPREMSYRLLVVDNKVQYWPSSSCM